MALNPTHWTFNCGWGITFYKYLMWRQLGMLPVEIVAKKYLGVSASLFTALTFPSSPHLFLSDLYRCATMKPHARVTPPGRGQTVACLTRLKSLRSIRTKDPRVGFHPFPPLWHLIEWITHFFFAHSINDFNYLPNVLQYYYVILSRHRFLAVSFPGVLTS